MKIAIASVIAAISASACCIGPVAFVMMGAGAFGATFSALEPYRPIMLGATMLLVGWAFYAAYRPMENCATCSPASRRRTQVAVWIAAVLVLVLAAFPYYVEFLF
ncbi:MAG: mercuric transporter MerT family protein [Longimicrobiales bacterium]